jgi:hypothetical protein
MEEYKGEPLEEMYKLWMENKARKEESHRKKLERDRKAKARWRAKQKVQDESANQSTSE